MQGHEAIQYFAKHGLDATPKLVHCIQASGTAAAATTPHAATDAAADAGRQDTQAHHSYDLRVVPRTQLPASYFTVSATGVVEVGVQAATALTASCRVAGCAPHCAAVTADCGWQPQSKAAKECEKEGRVHAP